MKYVDIVKTTFANLCDNEKKKKRWVLDNYIKIVVKCMFFMMRNMIRIKNY